MVRTKADGASGSGRKAIGGAAPRKSLGAPSTSGVMSSPSSNKYGGGNPVCPRPTPEWQKGIAMFMAGTSKQDKENDEPESNKNTEDNENTENHKNTKMDENTKNKENTKTNDNTEKDNQDE